MATLDINGKTVTVDVAPDTPLLWTLRDELGPVDPPAAHRPPATPRQPF
jgi:aerobic-type carbon monoxide dehydrogenase small subunit (CoxS/CutS family)